MTFFVVLDLNYHFNKCQISKPSYGIRETVNYQKVVTERGMRNHVRHFVKTTRDKINESLSTFTRSTKSPESNFSDKHKIEKYFTNSYFDLDLHYAPPGVIEQKLSQFNGQFELNCREFPRFSSVDNFFGETYKDLSCFENELNYTQRKLFKNTNFRKRGNIQRDNVLLSTRPQKAAQESSTFSNETMGNEYMENANEWDQVHDNLRSFRQNKLDENEPLNKRSLTLTRIHFEVPKWEDLCHRIFRFRPYQPIHISCFESDSKNSLPKEQQFEKKHESGGPSCRQDFFGTSIIEATPNQPKTVTQVELRLPETGIPVEPKDKFDVEQFLRCVCKKLYAMGREAHDSNSLEEAIEQLELSHLDDAFRHVNHLSSVFAYKTFLVDLCKERVKLTFYIDPKDSTLNFSLMVPLKCQKQPWPLTEDRFVCVLLHHLELLGVLKSPNEAPISSRNCKINDRRNCAQDMKRFGFMAYCRMQRKLDLVDSVLYREMLGDEHRWSFQGSEMLQIKGQLLIAHLS